MDLTQTKRRAPSAEVVDKVIAIYQSDEYSCMCPGQEEYKLVKTENGKVQMQKCLLLANLEKLHLEYVKTTGDL